jgi:mannosyltransferase
LAIELTQRADLETKRAAEAGPASPVKSLVSLWIGAAVFLHACIAVPLAYLLDIWTDEAFTLDTTGKSLGYALRQSINFEIQAPLYFLLLNVWRHLDGSILFARLFSTICVLLTIVIAARISKQLFRNLNPAWLAFWLAIHPYTIWAATETRLYAFAMLLAALLILLFLQGFKGDTQPKVYRMAYAIVAVAALYTHYYLGFILAANAVVLLVGRRWRMLGQYLLFMAAAGACFIPMLPTLLAQRQSAAFAASSPLTPLTALDRVVWYIKEFVLPIGEPGNPLGARRWLFRLFYCATVVLFLRTGRRLFSRKNLALITLLGALSVCFAFVLCVVPDGLLIERHMVTIFLPVLLFTFLLVNCAGRWWRPIVLSLLLGFSAWTSYATYSSGTKDGSWKTVATFLETNEKPGQPVLVFHPGSALPLAYYYHGQNHIIALPRGNRFDRFDLRDYVLHDGSEIWKALSNDPSETVWLVTDGKCNYAGVSYNCGVLEDFVQRESDILLKKNIGRTTIRLLHWKPQPDAHPVQVEYH